MFEEAAIDWKDKNCSTCIIISYPQSEKEMEIMCADRKFPLNECGIIMIITIGIKNTSLQKAKELAAELIQNIKDNGTISSKVNFYKEYFIFSQDDNKITIDCKII